jgi:glycosyltransferase involved in cell wall biosynthesis
MKQGFIIPVYRHIATVGAVAEELATHNLPIIIVDDGNEPEAKSRLDENIKKIPITVLVSLEKNLGKGGAFIKGLEKAIELGLTHVFQIDADGQHDLKKTAFFLEESKQNPDNIICGYPVFDHTAPKSRVTGRRISNFWTAVTTLSLDYKDALCGFRVYPAVRTLPITKNLFLDKRMGFDAEILVRLNWCGIYPLYHPIKVCYPEGGISNFRMIRDNARISIVFTRLSIGMLIRLPFLLIRKLQDRKKTT